MEPRDSGLRREAEFQVIQVGLDQVSQNQGEVPKSSVSDTLTKSEGKHT